MRSALTTSVLLSLATSACVCALFACAAPPIDDSLATDGTLPRRTEAQPDAGNTITNGTDAAVPPVTLTVNLTGAGSGTVASTPAGLTCAGTSCTGTFAPGTSVVLQPTAAAGSTFKGWNGAPCTGTTPCTIAVSAAQTTSAEFAVQVDGTWSGTYTHSEVGPNGCTFHNAGNLSTVITTAAGGAISATATASGFELRTGAPDCNLVDSASGTAAAATVTNTTGTLKGEWQFSVSGTSGKLPLPFTATITGKKMTGSWTCTGCTGTFTLTTP